MPITRTYYRPLPPSNPVQGVSYARPGETRVQRQMESLEAWRNYFRTPLLAEYARVREFYTKTWVPGHLGPYGLKQSGSDTPLPDIVHDYEDIRSDNKAAWAAAKRNGSISIVVSDYQKGRYKVSQSRGSSNLRVIRAISGYMSNIKSMSSVFGSTKGDAPYTVSYRGLHWHEQSSPYQQTYEEVTGTLDVSPLDLGFDFIALQEWLNKIPDQLTLNDELITDTLADANTGWVDLMTSVAEMPQTLRSILSGCTTIFRLYKDAKKGELRLTNRVKTVKLRLARLEAKTRKDFNDIRAWESHIASIKTAKQAIVDLTSAIAGVWLTYRLEIYPLAKTIEATIDAVMDVEKRFIRFRDQLRSNLAPPTFSGWELSGDLELVERCFIKRGARESEMQQLVFTSNPILTMWELVPLSFVLDRYMNIGNMIAAAIYRRDPKVTEGATYSWKIDSGFSYTHIKTGATVNVTCNLYKRRVIDPSSHVCIPFPPSRSTFQDLDHLALAWNLVIKRFIT